MRPKWSRSGNTSSCFGRNRAAGIDEVEAGQPVLPRDLLRPQVLLHGQREIGAALDRRVVGDDHAFAARDAADAGDDPRRRHVAAIHPIGGKRRQFEEGRAGIEQRPHPLARQQLAAREMPLRDAASPPSESPRSRPQLLDTARIAAALAWNAPSADRARWREWSWLSANLARRGAAGKRKPPRHHHARPRQSVAPSTTDQGRVTSACDR